MNPVSILFTDKELLAIFFFGKRDEIVGCVSCVRKYGFICLWRQERAYACSAKIDNEKTTPKQVRFQAPLPRYMYICRLEWLTYIEISKLKISYMYMQVQMPKYDQVYRKRSNKKW